MGGIGAAPRSHATEVAPRSHNTGDATALGRRLIGMNQIRPNSAAARDVAHALHPYTDLVSHQTGGPMIVSRGDGVYVYDDTGREFIESVAGLWCANLGFSNERLARAAYDQMMALPFYHAFTGKSHGPLIELSEMLIERAPGMSKVFFANSGSEANDTAVKMVWYYNNALGRPLKKKIIGRLKGYHGVTVASASLTGLPNNHRSFDLPLPGFIHTMTPHYYHGALPDETEDAFATRCADELDRLIVAEGPETIAAMFAEPIMGAGGVIVPPRGYFEKIQAVLHRHDVLLVVDEVICGFGRTGAYWGSQTFGIVPDIITCAKGLSAAFMPISAVLVTERVFQALAAQSHEIGTFGHGYTYSGHPVPAAVAIEALRIYDEIDIVEHVRTVGPVMQSELRRRFAGHALVGEVRGIGMIGAIELVEDQDARRNFPPAAKMVQRLVKHCEAAGVIARALPGDSLAFSPPLIMTEAEMMTMLDRVEEGLAALTAELA